MNTLLRTVLRVGVYSVLRRLSLKVTVALALAALALLVSVSGARAAELAYVERTTNLSFSGTTPAGDQLVAATFTVGAATKVRIELSATTVKVRPGSTDDLSLYIDGTLIYEAFGSWRGQANDEFLTFSRAVYETVAAGEHTISLRAWTPSGGTGTIYSNARTDVDRAPIFFRISSEPLNGVDGAPGAAGDSTSCGSVGQPVCAVALGVDDRDRLDLAWWGIWGVVGLVLVLLVAPSFSSLLRVTRGM